MSGRPAEGSKGLPVVALDVDGVLSVGPRRRLGPRWRRYQVEVPASDVPDSPFVVGHGGQSMSLSVVLNPGLHAQWITKLRDLAEVVWATTWEDAANTYLAPLLGIYPLPVGISPSVQLPKFSVARDRDTPLWKAMALAKRFAGRPLAWIDDQNRQWGDGWLAREGQPTLIITTDPHVGLTKDQMSQVEAFVRKHERTRKGVDE